MLLVLDIFRSLTKLLFHNTIEPKGCTTNGEGIQYMCAPPGVLELTAVVRCGFSSFMFRLFKPQRQLYFEIDEYLEWKATRSLIGDRKPLLMKFAKHCKKEELGKITFSDLKKFLGSIEEIITPFSYLTVASVIKGFFTYYQARGRECLCPECIYLRDDKVILLEKNAIIKHMKVKTPGRPKDWEMIQRVMKFRKAEMSFPEISRAMKKDIKQVYRWYTYGNARVLTK